MTAKLDQAPERDESVHQTRRTRPRLLFLSQALPYPPDGGVKVRTYNVLRLLARTFDVTALCFYRWELGLHDQDVSKATRALSPFGRIEAFPIPQEHSRVRLARDHLVSLLRRRVYTVTTYESRAYRSRLIRALEEQSFDLVHMDSLDLSGYLPLVHGLPVACTHHDAQSVLLRRRANVQDSWPRRAYLLRQAELMRKEEALWCPGVSVNVTVSPVDREVLRGTAPGGRFEVIPNGVDTGYFTPGQSKESGIVFVGGTSWFPNRDALEYFGDEILPAVRRWLPAVDVAWVGRSTSAERRTYRERFGISLTGYVGDVRPHVRRAACYVVPLRVGGGTRIKILDAWAMGKAVVSTSVGCEGLNARDGENIMVRDDPQEFAEAVHRVLTNPDLRCSLGRAARRTVEEIYSWEVIGEKQRRLYEEIMELDAPL